MAREGLLADELDRARKTWIGKQAMQTQSSAGLAQQCALDELYGLGFDHFEAVLESVRSITVEEVAAVCRRYFTAEPVLVAVGPEGEGSEKGEVRSRSGDGGVWVDLLALGWPLRGDVFAGSYRMTFTP